MTHATKLKAALAATVLGIAATATASDVSFDQAQLRAVQTAQARPVLVASADAASCECHPAAAKRAEPGEMRTGHEHDHPSAGPADRPTTGIHRR